MDDQLNYNQLKNEASSYLIRHAQSPIKWHTLGPDTLQKAQDENKPIFISVGYNSSHWCHVMAEECFSDKEIAKELNESFINIMIDKEELPDLDSFLQLACQAMNGRGGWPLNAFLTPDFKPYFIGTFLPKEKQGEVPGFLDIIKNMKKAYISETETVSENAENIISMLKQTPKAENKVQFEGHFPGPNAILNALKNYQDDDNGGYGAEPKFPHYSFFEVAVEQMLEGVVNQEFGQHILKSIESMTMSSLYDHAKGGVHRYCVDAKWQKPHFEKMLFDQAGFLKLLAKTSMIYPSPLIFDSMIQTIDYLHTEMLSENGYFFSGQDSDSEGMEGLYYAFTKDEFIDALTQFDEGLLDQQEKYFKWFDIKEEGNFQNMLNTIHLNPEYKDDFYSPEGWTEVRKIRQALLEARKLRIPPVTDRKGQASSNFQVLTALLEVIHYCKIDAIRQAATDLLQKTIGNIHETFLSQSEDGKTQIKTTTTRPEHIPLFEDAAFFTEFCFKAYEILGEDQYLENAINSLNFIKKEFFKDNVFYTRALSFNDSLAYANIHSPLFDQSYKSAQGTIIGLVRKWAYVHSDIKDFSDLLGSSIENLTHLSLQNPLGFGESIRALIYPDEAYRKIEVPKAWMKNKSFHPFLGNFSTRFALAYHSRDDESWSIGQLTSIEMQGKGIEEFAKVFTPPKQES